jgi:hypothetical protein
MNERSGAKTSPNGPDYPNHRWKIGGFDNLEQTRGFEKRNRVLITTASGHYKGQNGKAAFAQVYPPRLVHQGIVTPIFTEL